MKFSISAECYPERPRHLPDGCKSAQDASRMAPIALKTPPRWLQERPRRLLDGSKSAYDASPTAPRALEMSPPCSQEAPGRVQDGSKMPEGVPKSFLDALINFQDASESTQNAPKRRPGQPQRSPGALREALCSISSAKWHAHKTGQ